MLPSDGRVLQAALLALPKAVDRPEKEKRNEQFSVLLRLQILRQIVGDLEQAKPVRVYRTAPGRGALAPSQQAGRLPDRQTRFLFS